jgi:hypothetical protein
MGLTRRRRTRPTVSNEAVAVGSFGEGVIPFQLAHTFKYQTIGSSRLPRPFIPLTLRYKDRTVKIKALVDSGADFCMFDGELTSLLDIDLTKLEKINVSGVAGAAIGYVAHIEIGVEGQFFPTPAVFSFDFSPDEFGGLAGQLGFFDTYIVEFNRKVSERP